MAKMTLSEKIDKANLLANLLWLKACRWENVPTDAAFVVFSPDNPYDKPLNRARGLWLRLMESATTPAYWDLLEGRPC